ncbi:MAG: signal peptidase II [Anaerolineaceae bacterium]|nr:MAG: signal peptidase II [Anaerolineaceae bacterium]
MKRNFFTYLPLFLFVSLIVALDQWTKWLVRENIPFGDTWLPEGWDWLMPYARIVHWSNTGAAFGMFQNGNAIFTVLAIIVIIVIFYYYPLVEREDWSLRVAMGMQMAGAAGNLVDRLSRREVTDFISVGTFPVWNVADASITVGVAVLLLGIWLKERAERKASAQSSVSSDQFSVSNDQSETSDSKAS